MKILAVDDSNNWRSFHKTLLDEISADIEVTLASSAFDGFSTYEPNSFDLVITDLQMEDAYEPMYAGEWLVEQIKNISPTQKIIIISSCFDIDRIAESYNVHYLSKRHIAYDKQMYVDVIKNICNIKK